MLGDLWMFLRFVAAIGYLVRHITLGLLASLCVLAVVLWAVEDLSVGQAMYLTATTGLTIAYGDITPKTSLGRLVCVVVGLIGLILVGIMVAVANNAVMRLVTERSAADHHPTRDGEPTG